jgi:DNA processing protein
MNSAGLPDNAFAASIAALPDMTPARLRRLLRDRSAALVYEELLRQEAGTAERLVDTETVGAEARRPERLLAARELVRWWSTELVSSSPAELWARLRRDGVTVVREGDPAYPRRLRRLALPPELLHVKGDLTSAEGWCVGVVGTRRATHYGIGVAEQFGAELASRGIAVVSGLALGVDAAAHAGACARTRPKCGPIAVLGGGVDVVYPPRNASLYTRVIEKGAVMSEAPLGADPLPWRFPQRNRLIAGLSDVLVVVESSRQGGSMHTVEAADQINVPVLAVPGSIRSAQSEGTNALISQGGAHPALDTADILAALARAGGAAAIRLFEPSPAPSGMRESAALTPLPGDEPRTKVSECSDTEQALLSLMGDDVAQVDALCEEAGLTLREVVRALDHLSELGLVEPHGAGWVRT